MPTMLAALVCLFARLFKQQRKSSVCLLDGDSHLRSVKAWRVGVDCQLRTHRRFELQCTVGNFPTLVSFSNRKLNRCIDTKYVSQCVASNCSPFHRAKRQFQIQNNPNQHLKDDEWLAGSTFLLHLFSTMNRCIKEELYYYFSNDTNLQRRDKICCIARQNVKFVDLGLERKCFHALLIVAFFDRCHKRHQLFRVLFQLFNLQQLFRQQTSTGLMEKFSLNNNNNNIKLFTTSCILANVVNVNSCHGG
ncbi:hypothetical protein T02_7212 [Trichinella nativa]|uniref:Secreted protein n=1 Tax=Trichinella nativa TaxID=6335 RepID=A0A0V1L9N9_9BILA|nr:hypothetical protein T02_7212 [Trichinella nativa]